MSPWRLAPVLLLLAAGAASAAPRAVAPQPIHDAGTVVQGSQVRHVFVLRNEGDEPLVVHEVRPACGCTVADYDATVAPGGEGRIVASLDTAAFHGPIAKGLTVFTNDAANPDLRLTLKADVQPAIEAVPGYVRLQHVEGDPLPRVVQTVWATNGRGLELRLEEPPPPHLGIEVRRATAAERHPEGPEEQWLVITTLAADAPAGPLATPLALHTNHPQQPRLDIPVSGLVRPRVEVMPPAADFGRFRSAEPRRGSLVIAVHGERPVRLVRVTTDVPGLSARLATREEGRRYEVDLTLAAGSGPGPLRGMLRLLTDDPERPAIEVPVEGVAVGS